MPGLQPITTLPTPPSQNRPDSFGPEAEEFLGALPQFGTELNDWATSINQTSSDLMGGTVATSTTSMSVGAGSKSLTVQAGKNFVVGNFVRLFRTSAMTTQQMLGFVSAYNGATGALTVEVTEYLGSGTYTDWTVVRTFEEITTGTGPDQVPRNWMLGSAAWQNLRFIDFAYTTTGALTVTSAAPWAQYGPLAIPGVALGDFIQVACSVNTGGINVFGFVFAADTVYLGVHNAPASSSFTFAIGTIFYLRVMKRIA